MDVGEELLEVRLILNQLGLVSKTGTVHLESGWKSLLMKGIRLKLLLTSRISRRVSPECIANVWYS